jgi:hypothetical protein
LRDVPSNKRALLGLAVTKTDRLDSADELIARIEQASQQNSCGAAFARASEAAPCGGWPTASAV